LPAAAKEKPKKLTYMEQREWEQMEEKIAAAEKELSERERMFADPKVMADHVKMAEVGRAVAAAQGVVEGLYRRWEELEGKRGSG
jgi:ATP-binding cassette subfamily F protein uup